MSPSIPMTGMLKILSYFILNAIDFNFRNFGEKKISIKNVVAKSSIYN